MSVILFLLFGAYWAVANRLAGVHGWARYAPAIGFVLIATPLLTTEQVPFMVTAMVAYVLWRSIGWHTSIDMGKDAGTLLRDYSVFTSICVALTIPGLIWWSPLYLFFVLVMIPISYLAAMRILPNRPEFRHIAVAETAAGWMFGTALYLGIT